MATLQRSTAFRRQGSSGAVWDDKSLFKEDKVDYKELRPCQSTRVNGTTDPSNSKAASTAFPRSYSTAPRPCQSTRVIGTPDPGNSKAAPAAFPRSYSTAPVKQSFGKPLAIPKSKSIRRNLFSNLLFSNK